MWRAGSPQCAEWQLQAGPWSAEWASTRCQCLLAAEKGESRTVRPCGDPFPRVWRPPSPLTAAVGPAEHAHQEGLVSRPRPTLSVPSALPTAVGVSAVRPRSCKPRLPSRKLLVVVCTGGWFPRVSGVSLSPFLNQSLTFHPAWRPWPRPLVHVGPGGVVPAAPDSSPCPVFPAACVTSLAAPFPAATGSAGQQASEV